MAFEKVEAPTGADKKFYVYIYRDPRPSAKLAPIYVGKGTVKRRRADFHWKVRADNAFLAAILAKIGAAGLAPIVEIAGQFDEEILAFSFERELIEKFGRRNTGAGTLTNLTDGGDGASGYIPTAAEREVSRIRMKATRQKQGKDPNFRRLCVANLKSGRDKMRSDKKLQGLRAAKRAATIRSDPALAAKQSSAMREKRMAALSSPGSKAKFSVAMADARRKEWADNPEKRDWCAEKIRAATRASWADPQFRKNLVAKNSNTMKAKWADPDYRSKQGAKLSALLKAAWDDPEKRAAMLSKRAKRKVEAAARG